MVSEIYDQLYIREVERIIRRRLTKSELGELRVYGDFELRVRGHQFMVEVPKYSFPYDLINIDDIEYMYCIPYRQIKKYKQPKYLVAETDWSYLEVMYLKHGRPTASQYKSGERYIEFLYLLARAMEEPSKERE